MNPARIIFSALTILMVSAAIYQLEKHVDMDKTTQKKITVWDTYVNKKDGNIMHFDIIAPVEIKDTATIYKYGRAYLKTKSQEGQTLTSKQCRLCHIEILRLEWEEDIANKGYFIIEMEGCN